MPKIPVVGFLLQALGAVAIALMLSSFQRRGRRPGVRDWSVGLWSLAASLVAAVASAPFDGKPHAALRAAEFVLAYWSWAFILLGTWARWNDRELPRARWWLLGGFAVLGTLTAGAVAPWGLLLGMASYSVLALAAHLTASVLLLRLHGARPPFGARVLAVSFLGQAVEDGLFLAMAASGPIRTAVTPNPEQLVQAELLLLMLMGVGMISWLLEDESESAIALQQALHRKESLSAMGTLVGGVAHEVRNPLFAISATVDALMPRDGGNDPRSQHLAALREQTTRLSQLMTDLLDYGRPIASELEPGSVCAVAERAIACCADLSRGAGVRVELESARAAPLVNMDEPRLQQVFQNLVQNGIEVTPPGGRVRLEVRSAPRRGRAGVLCAVHDSGPGFDPAYLPHLFEPFFTRRRGGTGLGLSIVRRIVEQHSGDVEAANHPQGGGAVTVWLPAATTARSARRQRVPLG